MSHSPLKNDKKKTGLLIIGSLKIVGALLLLALSFGIFQMLGRVRGDTMEHYVRNMHIDTDNRFITNMLAKLSGVSAIQLRRVGVVTFIYATVYLVEGFGLIMAKRWAEYLTVILTGALVPLEIYGIMDRVTIARIIILIFNLIILAYLIYQLRAGKRKQLAEQIPISGN